MEDDIDIENAWKLTWWNPQFELKTTIGSDNQRKPNQLTKYPFLACTPMYKLAGHFLLKPAASKMHFLAEVLFCLPAWCPLQSQGPIQSTATPLLDVIITALFPSELLRRATQIWQACNNPRCPHQIVELSSHFAPSVQN